MNLLKKLLGDKSSPSGVSPPTVPANVVHTDRSKDPNLVRVYDGYGREMFITKQVWRDSVLVGHIKKVWDDPNALYSTIVQALQDGFGADMIGPAERLASIDSDAERSAVVLSIVYREQKRLDDSEKVIRRHIGLHGESGVVLTNLAKVLSARGDKDEALRTLWRALQFDPNQENGLGWYVVIHREKDGAAAALEATRRVAALPGAWRARVWLARDALSQRDLPAALAFYEQALALAPRPFPADLLQQISGDLGNNAHLPEILALVGPRYDPAVHGIAVGNNLIKTHVDLGQLDNARSLVDRLYAQKRPDWQKTLAFWDTEIAKARTGIMGTEMSTAPKIVTITIDGPIWLRSAQAAVLLSSPKATGAVVVACLCSSFTRADIASGEPRLQLSDAPGRLSRALPLYLAEQVHLRTDAIGRVLQPWVQQGDGGFVLCGSAWSDEQAVSQARIGPEAADYVAVLHLDGTNSPGKISLRLLRTIDGAILGNAGATFIPENPQAGFDATARDLIQLIATNAQVRASSGQDFYQVPEGPDFPQYMLRLEQALAVSIAAAEGPSSGFLSGERELVAGNLQLCLNCPRSPTTRLLLAQTMAYLDKVRPSIVLEFREKVALLQKEKPLQGPGQGVVKQILAEVFPE